MHWFPATPRRGGLPSTPLADAGSTRDDQARSLLSTIRSVSLVAAPIALASLAAGLFFGETRTALVGLTALVYAVWLFVLTRRSVEQFGERSVIHVAFATLGIIAVAAILEPAVGQALAIAALVPVVLAVPYGTARTMSLLMLSGGIIGICAWLAPTIFPVDSLIPANVQAGLSFITFVCSVVFLLIFLLQVSQRLKDTAADLRSVVTMSSDLARSLDPQLVGDGIARHIAVAVGSDECALSYWDREGDRVVTLGFHPPERRTTLADTYALDSFPATRRMLVDQRPMTIDIDDPTSDPAEVAYLEKLGQRSMLMIPLVASGTTIGVIEMTSDRSDIFDARRTGLATMLAHEAAMGLENARLYDKVRHQAFHDGLTGLANRVLFRDRVEAALASGADTGVIAVLFVDMDDFKDVNDRFGHDQGDLALTETGRRIAMCLRVGDLAARLGGDEFAILLTDVMDEATATAVGGRILEEIARPLDLRGVSVHVGASVGVAMSGSGVETVDELLRNADVAMYSAKVLARGGCELFRPELRDAMAARAHLAGRLRGAGDRGELQVEYQPVVDLETRSIIGLEALVRWQAPGQPLMMPEDFIGIAESTGEIVPIGRWVLREACRQTHDWQVRLGLGRLEISVNLSARQFQDPDLLATVRDALADSGLSAGDLVLELTESALMRDTDGTMARLDQLRALGVRLAIDDFGTGYSSLSYLQRFAVDILKIDRSFIVGLGARDDQPVLASAIVQLGRALGLTVIAEGIERQDQLDAIYRMGCLQGQGYLFSRPLAPSAVEVLLTSSALGQAAADASVSGRRGARTTLRLVSGD